MPIGKRLYIDAAHDRIHATISTTKADVPEEVRVALVRWHRLKRAAKPARPDPQAVYARAGAEMARAVNVGPPTRRNPGTVEPESLLPLEQADAFAAELARAEVLVGAFTAAQKYAAALATRVVHAHEPALVAALQARYSTCATALWEAAQQLPHNFTPEAAAYARDELAESWRAAVDAHEEMCSIRAVIIDVLDQPSPEDAVAVQHLRYTRSPIQRERTPFRVRVPDTGDPATLTGHLALARLLDSADLLWCPRAAQASALARELWPNDRAVGAPVRT